MDEIEFLFKMKGEMINTPSTKPPESPPIPERDWIILEKLSERPCPITPKDFADGMGPAFTVAKYSCRLAGAGNENKLAYMRIYKQIPLYGTRLDNRSVRQSQACGPRKHVELEALKRLTVMGCTATPKLLGYRIGTQDADDLVPGGYVIFLVWEKVPGESLDDEYFWSLPYNKRKIIRDRFQAAYREVLSSGYQPVFMSASKIILNKDTGDVKISGFSRAAPIDPDATWKDMYFFLSSLVLIPHKRNRFLPIKATDLRVDKHTGWMW